MRSECDPRLSSPTHRPAGHRLPQIVTEGVLRRGKNSDLITFSLRILRVIDLTFLVVLPEEGKTKAPVFVRFFLDRSQEDAPGSVVVAD